MLIYIEFFLIKHVQMIYFPIKSANMTIENCLCIVVQLEIVQLLLEALEKNWFTLH